MAAALPSPGLFSPGRIGPVEIRNRIVMPPMTTRLADAQGFATDATLAWYGARAAGGTGLVTVEMSSVETSGKHRAHELGINHDRFVPGLTRLARAIQDRGARASIQIGHAGGHTREDICGESPIAPSALPHYVYEVTGATIVPLEMTHDRIAQTTRAFAEAAARARRAGFDCVELHGAHGYLLSQFLCPRENIRTDDYGGSLENRARFALGIVRAVREAVPDAGLIYRMSADDLFPGGFTQDEGMQLARWVQAAGADAIHVSAGHYRSLPSPDVISAPMSYPDGNFLHFARAVKAIVTVPVIAVGRLGDPDLARGVIESGQADFVSLGRTLIADPQWAAKVASGRAVRPCLACNTCANEMRSGAAMGCVVNAAAARELSLAPGEVGPRKRIAVIGAGPAGLSYAHLAAARHDVTLFERGSVPGGAFLLTGKAPLFQDVVAAESTFARYVSQMLQACHEAGVDVRLNADPLRNDGLRGKFDVVVIAAGARYRWGLGPIARWLLESGSARKKPWAGIFSTPGWRQWFYYTARAPLGESLRALVPAGIEVRVIGDARQAGKSREAIADAFQQAWDCPPVCAVEIIGSNIG